MGEKIYNSPFRVYLVVGVLALFGVLCGLNLPISLFPKSSRPIIYVNLSYGSSTAREFMNQHGNNLEQQFRRIRGESIEAESVDAFYNPSRAQFVIKFKWGSPARGAEREVMSVAQAYAARLPTEVRDSLGVWLNEENAGFFAVSFFSSARSLDALYEILEPVLTPKLLKIPDAAEPVLFNPSKKEIKIEPIPEVMASLQLFPKDIERAILGGLGSLSGGSLNIGLKDYSILLPRRISSIDEVGRLPIITASGKSLSLTDVARIDLSTSTTQQRSFKTNGTPSLILFASPRAGGNVKKMSEDMLAVVKETLPSLPSDVEFRVLVDPSEFIRSAIANVFKEVGLAAFLAVVVLFLFIGSIRNVATAAIEIPLSMVLAFILMRLFNMNLNLISLGGLALSAGMNVDASVVVMENIIRHFEKHAGPLSATEKLGILQRAVGEVRVPVIASTIASLVVFLPLIFTSDLTYAILGDLAKAVVFSHGFSAIVALILVPTVRLHLLSKETKHPRPLLEKQILAVEHFYANCLHWFLHSVKTQILTGAGLTIALAILLGFVLPRLPREVLGKPDTDWLVVEMSTEGNTVLRQMETQIEEIEKDFLKTYGKQISYTFTMVSSPNHAEIMARLNNKSEMRELWKQFEKRFVNTPTTRFDVGPWNPSELPIPDPPHMQIEIHGSDPERQARTAREISQLLKEKKVFPRLWSQPEPEIKHGITIEPYAEQWSEIHKQFPQMDPADVLDLIRVSTLGKPLGTVALRNDTTSIQLRYPRTFLQTLEELKAFPIQLGSKLVPLRSLMRIEMGELPPLIYRKEQKPLYVINGKENKDEESKAGQSLIAAKNAVADWERNRKKTALDPTVSFEDPGPEVTKAMHELGWATALSVFLIFFILLFQFGSWIEPLLVLVSIPLGVIGVLISLTIFDSTLSLNSVLGVILLNGIAVANSIILVDFIKRRVAEGLSPVEAAREAATTRLRPILITSLTTILGMLPVALGLGEGGRILQPLGIAVSGGLWFSMLLTLFLVPALQVRYFSWREAWKKQSTRERFSVLISPLSYLINRFRSEPV